MSAPSHELAQYLHDEGAAVLGDDLYTGQEPTTPNDVTTLYDTGGGPPRLYDEELRESTIQVRTRAASYDEAYRRQQDAFDLLNAIKGEIIGDHRYVGIWLTSDVTNTGADDNDRIALTTNYRIERHQP